jgi:hypothetical protein
MLSCLQTVYCYGMKRTLPFLVLAAIIISCKPDLIVDSVVQLDYASGSGIATLNKQVFVIGDDLNYLLVCDSNLTSADTIYLADSQLTRIPKNVKQDLEAATIQRFRGLPLLLLFGSGSDSNRNTAWVVNTFKRERQRIELDTFYSRLMAEGIKDLNIEGATSFYNGYILSNRGHFGNPANHLVFLRPGFWEDQSSAWFRLVKVGTGKEDNSFRGVSGLEYSKRSDQLLLTVSTEHTYDNVSDGAIGKSYLWIIDNISSKRRMAAINPSRVIDLEKADERFRGQKVESVTILSESRKEMVVALVCDNDDGRSTVFKVRIKM